MSEVKGWEMESKDTLRKLAEGQVMIGQRLRVERERQSIGLRELARRVGVSASLISQIELGRANPSVATLYAIVNELGVSLDELFADDESAMVAAGRVADDASGQASPVEAADVDRGTRIADFPMPRGSVVVRHDARHTIHLGSGVTWERMNSENEPDVDFLYVTYGAGGESAPEDALIRHQGREYGHLLEGRLSVTVGFQTHELGAGDAISFESTTPHRLYNPGDTPARAIWYVVGRNGSSTDL